MDINKIFNELTIEEKIAIVSGTNFMYTNAVDRLGIPAIRMADGPHGLRVQTQSADNGITSSEKATSFPTASCTASGWNADNLYKIGQAIANECHHYGVNVLLGPGVNMKRNPLCGRNFEYFSEDPLLSGTLASAQVKGLQSKGVGACIKHFAVNNSENYRIMGNSVCDERAMREIYLKSFEKIVKDASPYAIMCAYNKINGEFCSQNKWLLTDVLRTDWGFDGAVMTDWGAMRDRVASIKAGLDLEMPGDSLACRKEIFDGIKTGSLSMEELDECVKRVLSLVYKVEPKKEIAQFEEHNELCARISEDCAVLMENDGTLPLDKNEKILVVGELFDKMRYQGAGSSMINPAYLTTPKNAFERMGIRYEYFKGYAENQTDVCPELVTEAIKASEDYDKVLVFCGLTDYVESEGEDRASMSLPQNQTDLIEKLIDKGKKVVLVLFGGSPIALPFAKKTSAILNMFLPGQNGGTSCANLLFGLACPNGRLSETWAQDYSCVPFGEQYSNSLTEKYKESVFVGYRYYASAPEKIAYPFGYGLSYTKFEIEDVNVQNCLDEIKVECVVKNVGEKSGAHVVQVYVKAPQSKVFKPQKELRAFKKVYLESGEFQKVSLAIQKTDLAFFDHYRKVWVIENGEYEVQVSNNALDVVKSATLTVLGETVSEYDAPKTYYDCDLQSVTDGDFEKLTTFKMPVTKQSKEYTLETPIVDYNRGFWPKLIYKMVVGRANKIKKLAKKYKTQSERDNVLKGAKFMETMYKNNCFASMSVASSGLLPLNLAKALVCLANGKVFAFIKHALTPIKAPPLPKNAKRK